MKARSMQSKAVVAAAMMMAVMASSASATGLQLGHSVAARTVAKYYTGAWTSPCAVVLKSAADWQAWNHEMVATGKAVAEEAAPAGVNWSREAVLVVSLGQNPNRPMALDLAGAMRDLSQTEVSLNVDYSQGGSAPSVVVAMDRSLVNQVQLDDAAAMGLPAQAVVYTASPAQSAGQGGGAVAATTWGAMKAAYRQ